MSVIYIQPGQLIVKDPSDEKVVAFDWITNNVQSGATITASTFTVTAVKPSKTDTALILDSANLGGNGRVRMKGGTLGQIYEIANKIVTNESPAQTKEKSFRVLIQNL
jgi:hypothetical protein